MLRRSFALANGERPGQPKNSAQQQPEMFDSSIVARHGDSRAARDELKALSRLLARRAARLHQRSLGCSPLSGSLPLVLSFIEN